MPKLRKNIADVTTSFELSFLFAANLYWAYLFGFHIFLKTPVQFWNVILWRFYIHTHTPQKHVCLDKVRCYSADHISVALPGIFAGHTKWFVF